MVAADDDNHYSRTWPYHGLWRDGVVYLYALNGVRLPVGLVYSPDRRRMQRRYRATGRNIQQTNG